MRFLNNMAENCCELAILYSIMAENCCELAILYSIMAENCCELDITDYIVDSYCVAQHRYGFPKAFRGKGKVFHGMMRLVRKTLKRCLKAIRT